jgi:hypothetical protein
MHNQQLLLKKKWLVDHLGYYFDIDIDNQQVYFLKKIG